MVVWRFGLDISDKVSSSKIHIYPQMTANLRIGKEAHLKLLEVMSGKMSIQRPRNKM